MGECYNPYMGVKYERDLKAKSAKEYEKARREYLRDVSFDPRHMLQDCYGLFETLSAGGLAVEDLYSARHLKAIGFVLVAVALILYTFTFLR